MLQAARWDRRRLPAEMAREGITGFLPSRAGPREVSPSDAIRLTERRSEVSVADVTRVTYRDRHDSDALHRIVAVPKLADQWHRMLLKRLSRGQLPVREFGT